MPRRRLLAIIAALVVVATSCLVVEPPSPPVGPQPPVLVAQVVATGLSKPWDIGFTNEGVAFFNERGGDISVLVGRRKRLLHRPDDVRTGGEGGMLGLVVDPQFSTNRFIYACFTSSLGSEPPGAPADARVVRWKVNSSLTALSDRTNVVIGIPYSSGRHSGCRPRFGPDGYLWVTTGDAAIGTTPQDLTSLGGKVLRVDRDGNAAPDNPDLTALDPAADPRIYTYGHRNPQGIAFEPGTDRAFTVEHGPDRDDEVNLLQAGMNAGWNPVPGYDESVSMTDFTLPGNVVGAVWSSGSPTIAPSGAAFMRGNKWGEWQGALVVAVLKDRHLHVFFLDAAGNVTADTTILGELDKRLRSVVHNPANGFLYLTTDVGDGGGQILRLVPL